MRCKRNLLVAAVAGLGLALGGCRSSNPCDPCGSSRPRLFGRMFSRPCCSSPAVVEAGPPALDEGFCGPACPTCPTCSDFPAAPVSFGEGPLLGTPALVPGQVPPPVYTNGGPPIGAPRLVPQPQAQPIPYTP